MCVELLYQHKHRIYLEARSVSPMMSRPPGTSVRHIHKPVVHRYPFDMRQFYHLGSPHTKPCEERFRCMISFRYISLEKQGELELLAES